MRDRDSQAGVFGGRPLAVRSDRVAFGREDDADPVTTVGWVARISGPARRATVGVRDVPGTFAVRRGHLPRPLVLVRKGLCQVPARSRGGQRHLADHSSVASAVAGGGTLGSPRRRRCVHVMLGGPPVRRPPQPGSNLWLACYTTASRAWATAVAISITALPASARLSETGPTSMRQDRLLKVAAAPAACCPLTNDLAY